MDGSDHKSKSSSSTSNKQRPSIPKGVDGNGKSNQENDKATKTKLFMSPKISATSKFNPSRKKILAVRNESLDDPKKTPNLDSNRVQKASSYDSHRSSSTDFAGSEHSSKPYDPLTNYLSPRPKFLRYKPNRRREILLRRATEEKEGENDAVAPISELDSASSCGSLPQLETSEVKESDSEFEDAEEERGWGVKGVLNFLLLLLVLALSTSYISSMNSPTPSPVVQAVVGLRDGYRMMQNHVYENANQIFLLFDGAIKEKRILVVRIQESRKEPNEVQVEYEEEVGKSVEAEGSKKAEEEIVELDGGETLDTSNSELVETEEENEEERGEADRLGEEGSKREEIVAVEGKVWNETTELDGGKIRDFGNSEELGTVGVSVSDSEVDLVETPVRTVADALEKEKEAGSIQESVKEDIFERDMDPIGNLADVYKIGDRTESNFVRRHMKDMETESVLKVVVGLSVLVLSSIILGLPFRKRRNGRENTQSPPPVAEPAFESPLPDEDKPIESSANFLISNSLINSMDEASKAKHNRFHWSLSHENRAAPTIELLGELEVSEMSIPLRSCGIKTSRVIENEVSSHSVSITEKTTIGSKPPSSSYPVDVQTSASSKNSTFNHSTYSDEKKSAKKKESESVGGNQSEGKKVSTTTPLRRSSRIRNQVTSP